MFRPPCARASSASRSCGWTQPSCSCRPRSRRRPLHAPQETAWPRQYAASTTEQRFWPRCAGTADADVRPWLSVEARGTPRRPAPRSPRTGGATLSATGFSPRCRKPRQTLDVLGLTTCRLVHAASLDRVDAMRPPGRRALLRPVIAHRHVDALVVDGAAPTVGPRIEEGAANWMLALERQHRPSAPRVVVRLQRLKPTWNTLRHVNDLSRKPSIEPLVRQPRHACPRELSGRNGP